MKFILNTILLVIISFNGLAQDDKANAILGKWMSVDNNLEVEVFKDGDSFKAKVLWFDDSDDKSKPMYL